MYCWKWCKLRGVTEWLGRSDRNRTSSLQPEIDIPIGTPIEVMFLYTWSNFHHMITGTCAYSPSFPGTQSRVPAHFISRYVQATASNHRSIINHHNTAISQCRRYHPKQQLQISGSFLIYASHMTGDQAQTWAICIEALYRVVEGESLGIHN
jgi:hypothetical protein